MTKPLFSVRLGQLKLVKFQLFLFGKLLSGAWWQDGLNKMDIQYGASVVDKNERRIGTVNKVILDTWSGEPRKYAVCLDGKIDLVFFTPQQVASATADGVKLDVAMEEIEGA